MTKNDRRRLRLLRFTAIIVLCYALWASSPTNTYPLIVGLCILAIAATTWLLWESPKKEIIKKNLF